MTTKTIPLTKNVEIKKKFTPTDKLEILDQISEIDKSISEKQFALANLQEQVKELKEGIAGLFGNIGDLCKKYQLGYESKWTECVVTYADGLATFTDAKTGEVVDQREITEEEQLSLSSNRIDAENIIRQASKEED